MPNPKGKCVYHLVCSTDDKKQFDKMYPKLLKIFLERSMKLAIKNKSFFDSVFFSDEVFLDV